MTLISSALFDSVAALAAASPRLRMNHNFHAGPDDNPHRFLNVLLKGTYIRPHRHVTPPKSETFIVLEGAADVLIFNEEGAVTSRHRLGSQMGSEMGSEMGTQSGSAAPGGRLWGVDLPPGVWHTIVARTERVVCFEVKPGPWRPATDKDFAAWAPAENDPSAAAYAAALFA